MINYEANIKLVEIVLAVDLSKVTGRVKLESEKNESSGRVDDDPRALALNQHPA